VPDAARGLREVRRVLKPGGSFRFLEHVRNDESPFWGRFQDVIAPGWRWFGAGCNPNRRTKGVIEDAGFRFDWIERASTGFGMPAIYGVARPS
jgi:ubiquinone/menaquinone biosynthesis C-methylase UbiE